jgi:S-adenosylmethionine:tRNA ribosyltransferase-isomerase
LNFDQLSLYDYNLPKRLIAQRPLAERTSSRLMVVNRNKIEHLKFSQIIDYFKPGDVIVRNSSKVIPARLSGRKTSGAKIEIFLLKPSGEFFDLENPVWKVMIKPAKRVSLGSIIIINHEFHIKIIDKNIQDGTAIAELVCEKKLQEHLEEAGMVPVPPYITDPLKKEYGSLYQTCYSKVPGSVAAPTAGFHFTNEFDKLISAKGVVFADLILHVGLGTFRPVSSKNVSNHKMHSEFYELSKENADIINSAKRVIAVGTTSVRVLETCAVKNNSRPGRVFPKSGWTDIFIKPGYLYSSVDLLITNFHLPCSTLIMLVSAFGGYNNIMNAYKEAVFNEYRFYSFGDSMLVFPNQL